VAYIDYNLQRCVSSMNRSR